MMLDQKREREGVDCQEQSLKRRKKAAPVDSSEEMEKEEEKEREGEEEREGEGEGRERERGVKFGKMVGKEVNKK